MLLHSGSNEFSVIDLAALVGIYAFNNIFNFFILSGKLLKAISHFLSTQDTIAISVKLGEQSGEFFKLSAAQLSGNIAEGNLLQSFRANKTLQDVQVELQIILLSNLFLHPGVLEDLFRAQSLVDGADTLSDKGDSFLRNVLPLITVKVVDSLSDRKQDLIVVLAVEGGITTQQNVKDDTSRPDIALFVILSLKNFGGNVIRCSDLCLEFMRASASKFLAFDILLVSSRVHELLRQTKIDHLDGSIRLFAHVKEILGLQISMADVFLVEVEQSPNDLFKNGSCFIFAEMTLLYDSVEQLTTITNFHNQINIHFVFKGLIKLDNIGMIDISEDINLNLELFGVLNSRLGDNFAGPHFLGFLMSNLGNLSKGTFANNALGISYTIVVIFNAIL